MRRLGRRRAEPRGRVRGSMVESATIQLRPSNRGYFLAMQIRRQGLFAAAALVLAVVSACSSSSDSSSSSSTKVTTTTTRAQNPNSKLSATAIKQLQADLRTVGCFSGVEDGVIGPVTRSGIEDFQRAKGLAVDGQYGAETRAKLTNAAADGATVCTATTTTTTAASGPPCTSAAITAAVPGDTVLDFGCNSGWAWAGIDTGGADGYEATALLKANGAAWKMVDRTTYCVPASNIPPDIYSPGCTTN
jgi:Putative peptidoglycan binding domain